MHYGKARRGRKLTGRSSFTHPGGRNEAKPVSSQSRQRSRSVPGLALRRLRIGAVPDTRITNGSTEQ